MGAAVVVDGRAGPLWFMTVSVALQCKVVQDAVQGMKCSFCRPSR